MYSDGVVKLVGIIDEYKDIVSGRGSDINSPQSNSPNGRAVGPRI